MEEIRLLGKDDIDVRVAQTMTFNGGYKVSLLLYKDARVDMKILDELYTPMGWKRTHKVIGDRLYCCVEVYNHELKEWISKEDVGVESNTEAEKGQASDSFKRACVNWGIGRELYTAPRIVVSLNSNEYTKDQNGRLKVWTSFSVKSIGYDTNTRTITSLEIQDKNGIVRFSYGIKEDKPTAPKEEKPAPKTGKKAKETKTYTPVDNELYWKIVKCYAEGKLSKSGQDYKKAWIEMTNADADAILKFDEDVQNYIKTSLDKAQNRVRRNDPFRNQDLSPQANQEIY